MDCMLVRFNTENADMKTKACKLKTSLWFEMNMFMKFVYFVMKRSVCLPLLLNVSD